MRGKESRKARRANSGIMRSEGQKSMIKAVLILGLPSAVSYGFAGEGPRATQSLRLTAPESNPASVASFIHA